MPRINNCPECGGPVTDDQLGYYCPDFSCGWEEDTDWPEDDYTYDDDYDDSDYGWDDYTGDYDE